MTIRSIESELPSLEGKTIAEQYPDEEAEDVPFDFREAALLSLCEARSVGLHGFGWMCGDSLVRNSEALSD